MGGSALQIPGYDAALRPRPCNGADIDAALGGERAEVSEELGGGYYYEPTVLKGHNGMRVFQEEIFGPVLAVTTFKDEAEALAIANDTMYGLGAGVWTFEDVSEKRPVTADLTPREREIAALLVEGKTSKVIARETDLSPRTVEMHRAKLMKKFSASTSSELVHKLVGVAR